MTPKEEAERLIWQFLPPIKGWTSKEKTHLAKELALISLVNKYNHLREYLYGMKASGINISDKVYLARLENLILEEHNIKEAIKNF